jgi:hypothetical protein
MQKKNIITGAVILAVAGGMFYGGAVYEKNSLSSQGLLRNINTQAGNRPAGAQQGQGRQGGAMGSGGANRGGDFAVGQITAKDDKSITIKAPDGSSKIVFFSDSTTVGKATQAMTADLNIGDQVTVNGKSSADGSLSAQNIQIRPSQQTPPQAPAQTQK